MVQIIAEERKPRFSDQLMQGLSNLSQTASTEIPRFFGEKMMREKENKQISNLIGQDIAGIQDPKLRQQIVKDLMAGNIKSAQKVAPLKAGLDTIKRMRTLGEKGNLGKTFTRGVFGGEQAKERAEYEQLGKSLIQLASTIPIRNKIEFETLANKLYDPSIRDTAREGILDAMERIISHGLQDQDIDEEESDLMTKRPPLSSFRKMKG